MSERAHPSFRRDRSGSGSRSVETRAEIGSRSFRTSRMTFLRESDGTTSDVIPERSSQGGGLSELRASRERALPSDRVTVRSSAVAWSCPRPARLNGGTTRSCTWEKVTIRSRRHISLRFRGFLWGAVIGRLLPCAPRGVYAHGRLRMVMSGFAFPLDSGISLKVGHD